MTTSARLPHRKRNIIIAILAVILTGGAFIGYMAYQVYQIPLNDK